MMSHPPPYPIQLASFSCLQGDLVETPLYAFYKKMYAPAFNRYKNKAQAPTFVMWGCNRTLNSVYNTLYGSLGLYVLPFQFYLIKFKLLAVRTV